MEETENRGAVSPKSQNKCPIWVRLLLIFAPMVSAGLCLFFAISELLSHDGRVNLGADFNDYGSAGFRVLSVVFAIVTVVLFVLQFVLPKAVFKKRVVVPGIVFNSIMLVASIAGGYMGGSLLGTHYTEKSQGADDFVYQSTSLIKQYEDTAEINNPGRLAITELVERYGATKTDAKWIELASSYGPKSSAEYKKEPELGNYTDFTRKTYYHSEWVEGRLEYYYNQYTQYSYKFDCYLGGLDIAAWAQSHANSGIAALDAADNTDLRSGANGSLMTSAYGTHKSKTNSAIKPIRPTQFDYGLSFAVVHEVVQKTSSETRTTTETYGFTCVFDIEHSALRIACNYQKYTL